MPVLVLREMRCDTISRQLIVVELLSLELFERLFDESENQNIHDVRELDYQLQLDPVRCPGYENKLVKREQDRAGRPSRGVLNRMLYTEC